MNDRNAHEDELENEDQWDFDAAEVRPGVSKPRAVVSVAFTREDFGRVSECAALEKKRTSVFIREAALEKASRSIPLMVTSSSSNPQWVETHLSTPNQRPEAPAAWSGVGMAYR